MNRSSILNFLKANSSAAFDIIVIGGGATGLGIALDAVTRGYKTILLEQSDFASGTSSRSTKLVHGGVRYLAQGDLPLVIEALHERGLILRNAPHLAVNQEFIIPAYSFWDVILYTVGLTFYDILAGRLSLGRSHFISRNKTLARLPLLKTTGLKGGIVYHDGRFDDSRMAVALADTCIRKGGLVLNYFKVVSLLKNEKGKITGLLAKDMVSGEEHRLLSKLVINATGVFADSIALLDNPSAKPTIRPSQGVHVVLDKSFLQSNSAIMIPKTDDGRVLFAIPWYNSVVVGTTDTPIEKIDQEPLALDKEIGFILHTAGNYLTRPPKRSDVLSVFAGLRPLAATQGKNGSTKEVSRRHKITLSPSGLLTIIGGKWTTYRCMAEETINRAIKAGILPEKRCITSSLKLIDNEVVDLNDRLHIYGDGAAQIRKIINENPETGIPLHADLPYIKAEILWICRHEMPVDLDDVLARRTRSLFLNARASASIASAVAAIMASELGENEEWQHYQLDAYNKLVKNYL